MFKNPQVKGYLLALLAAFTATNTYFTSKHILNTNTVFQFGILWYGFACLFNVLYLIFSGNWKYIFSLSAKNYRVLLLFSALEIITTTAFFTAIKMMENPAIVSFLGNMTPAIVTIFAIILLKERFNKFEMTGVVLAISGSFLVSFHWNLGLNSFFVKGSGLVFISVLASSANTILIKKYIAGIYPGLFSLARVAALLVFSFIAILFSSQSFKLSTDSALYAMYGAFIGPLMGSYAAYYALKYIAASKAIVIQSVKCFLILFGAFFLLGLWPLWIQVIGGVLSVSGVVLLTVFRAKYK